MTTTPSVGGGPFGLRVEDLRVELGGVAIVDGVSCAAQPGKLLGVIGPNGSGKTTLLRAMAGVLQPASGVVYVGQRAIGDIRPRDRGRAIAYLPQSDSRAHSFTSLEAVLMGRYPHLGRFQIEGRRDREIALAAMARTETVPFAARRLGEVSGGELQRILLARTLAQEPEVLLLDEPTASLDLKHQLSMMALVHAEVRNGTAAVAVLHDLSLAGRFCDRLLLLHRGRAIAAGTPGEVLTPENLRDAFGVDAAVDADPVTGRPRVALLGPSDDNSNDDESPSGRVHLICGAGSGRFLMQALVSAGHTLTAGVLGTGDTDREAAERIGLDFVPSPAFSPIDERANERHIDLVRRADCVVVCDMPVGANNLANLEAALVARRLYLLAERPFERRDHTCGGQGTAVFAELEKHGTLLLAGQVVEVIARDLADARST